jgi:hypothetical protein
MFAIKFTTYNFVDAKKCNMGIELRNRVYNFKCTCYHNGCRPEHNLLKTKFMNISILKMTIHYQIILNFWKSIMTKIKIHCMLNKVINSCGGFIIGIDMGVYMGVKLSNGWKKSLKEISYYATIQFVTLCN